MLVRIHPQQVSKFASLIDYAIAESFGLKGKSELKLFNLIKEKLILGIMQFWVHYKDDQITFAMITSITEEPDTERRLLTIYSIKGLKPVEQEDFKQSFNALKDFAVAERITVIQAFYVDERISELIKLVTPNFKVKYYAEMEV